MLFRSSRIQGLRTLTIFPLPRRCQKNAKKQFPPKRRWGRFRRAITFLTGSQNRTFLYRPASRPSQNLKKHGFGPYPKNASKIGAPIDALVMARNHVFYWKTNTFVSFPLFVKCQKSDAQMDTKSHVFFIKRPPGASGVRLIPLFLVPSKKIRFSNILRSRPGSVLGTKPDFQGPRPEAKNRT